MLHICATTDNINTFTIAKLKLPGSKSPGHCQCKRRLHGDTQARVLLSVILLVFFLKVSMGAAPDATKFNDNSTDIKHALAVLRMVKLLIQEIKTRVYISNDIAKNPVLSPRQATTVASAINAAKNTWLSGHLEHQ